MRPTLRELGALAPAPRGGWRDDGRPWLAGWLFSPEFRREQPERVSELLRHFGRHRAPPQGVWSHCGRRVYHDTTSRLDCIQAPTLVMHGEHDAMAPISNARLLAERIPDAELRIVPGAGHAYLLERPRRRSSCSPTGSTRRSPIAAGRRAAGLAARAEPLTRALGLPIGAARTGRSLAGLAADRLRRRSAHVATDR